MAEPQLTITFHSPEDARALTVPSILRDLATQIEEVGLMPGDSGTIRHPILDDRDGAAWRFD